MITKLRVGTRSSPLAMAQTQQFCQLFQISHPNVLMDIVPILTMGDRIQDRSLADVGGKALFVKELERSLQDGVIDVAVHSFKDMECTLANGLRIGAVLKREDPRDVFVGPQPLMQMPSGARIGTCAPRRCAQIQQLRPDLNIIPIRGNIQTRLQKVISSEVDGIVMAYAGLARCGLTAHIQEVFEPSQFLPAAAQGVIAVEYRAADEALGEALTQLNDPETWACVQAERSFLKTMNGNCHTPLGAYAALNKTTGLWLRVMSVGQDQQLYYHEARSASIVSDSAHLGERAAHGLQEQMKNQRTSLCI